MSEKFLLICDCGWKRTSNLDGFKDVVEIKNDTMSSRKFRCPHCGLAMTPKKVKDPQSEFEKIKKEREVEEENKRWIEESIRKQATFMKDIINAEEDND